MKLTARGRDYLLASLLLVGIGLVSRWELFGALSLALLFSSLASLAVMRTRAQRSVRVELLKGKLSLVKGEEGRLSMSMPGRRSWWSSAEVESVRFAGPVESRLAGGTETEDVIVKPLLAGRFTDAALKVRVQDALGVFYSTREVKLEGVMLDSLPVSMVSPIERAYVPPLVVGESPAGMAGRGQEFFGVEAYTQRSESKDILWSRAAKDPSKPLMARVREANNPERVAIRMVYGRTGSLVEAIDLQCEALGTVGRALIQAGVGVVLVGRDGTSIPADTDEELAEGVMWAAALGAEDKGVSDPRGDADILVVVGELGEDAALSTPRRPTVFVGGDRPPIADRFSVTFTGGEDLSKILNLVLSR